MALKVEEMVEEIRELGEQLFNMGEEIGDLAEEQELKATKTALQLIQKYNIPLFYNYNVGVTEEIKELLQAKSKQEFLQKLKKYRYLMEWWHGWVWDMEHNAL